jgi:hypothetical protein
MSINVFKPLNPTAGVSNVTELHIVSVFLDNDQNYLDNLREAVYAFRHSRSSAKDLHTKPSAVNVQT